MPCPHFDVSIVSRSDNSSAVAASAYQSGERLRCEYDQKIKYYPSKDAEVVYKEILLPEHAPEEFSDRAILWNSAETVEIQWNAQLARKLIITLPRELPLTENIALIHQYCDEQFRCKGMVADVCMHDPDPPGHNPHVHVLLTMRSLDENGRWMQKATKEYDLDENGERIPLPSGEWKSHKVYTNDWNDRGNVSRWRDAWEKIQNWYLEKNGRPERVSLQSYVKQGIDRIPEVHMGPAVAHLEAKGVQTNIGDLNRDIRKANSLLQSIRQILRGLFGWLDELNEKKKIMQTAMREVREKQKEPTLRELLLDFYQIRAEERQEWSSSHARFKGAVADYERVIQVADFLDQHSLYRLDDLHTFLSDLEEKYNGIRSEMKSAEKRMRDIDQIQSAVKTIRELQPVKDGWFKKNFKSTKERYAAAHADELKRYNSAYRLLKKLCGRTDVDLKALSAEHHALEKKVIVKTDELETIRGDLKELRTIRYYVSRVLPEEPAPENVPVQVQLSEGRLRSGIDQEKKQRTPKKQMEKHIEESQTKRR